MNPPEKRRAPRKRAPDHATVTVTDVISGRRLGLLGNLSASGMLLLDIDEPPSEAVFQVSFVLPNGLRTGAAPLEVGIQEQWHELAASTGRVWAGYRIIAISDEDGRRLDRWLAHA